MGLSSSAAQCDTWTHLHWPLRSMVADLTDWSTEGYSIHEEHSLIYQEQCQILGIMQSCCKCCACKRMLCQHKLFLWFWEHMRTALIGVYYTASDHWVTGIYVCHVYRQCRCLLVYVGSQCQCLCHIYSTGRCANCNQNRK